MSKRSSAVLALILAIAGLAAASARAQLPPDEMTTKTVPGADARR